MLAADLPVLFEFQLDPIAARMAAFMGGDFAKPTDVRRANYLAKFTRLLADPAIVSRTIEFEGRIVGLASSFPLMGDREVTYWIDRPHWGKGLATFALRDLLAHDPIRPLHARAASDNIGSRRVLEKAGFVRIGSEISMANARGAEIEETIYRLGR